jgi:hypothetical protein
METELRTALAYELALAGKEHYLNAVADALVHSGIVSYRTFLQINPLNMRRILERNIDNKNVVDAVMLVSSANTIGLSPTPPTTPPTMQAPEPTELKWLSPDMVPIPTITTTPTTVYTPLPLSRRSSPPSFSSEPFQWQQSQQQRHQHQHQATTTTTPSPAQEPPLQKNKPLSPFEIAKMLNLPPLPTSTSTTTQIKFSPQPPQPQQPQQYNAQPVLFRTSSVSASASAPTSAPVATALPNDSNWVKDALRFEFSRLSEKTIPSDTEEVLDSIAKYIYILETSPSGNNDNDNVIYIQQAKSRLADEEHKLKIKLRGNKM